MGLWGIPTTGKEYFDQRAGTRQGVYTTYTPDQIDQFLASLAPQEPAPAPDPGYIDYGGGGGDTYITQAAPVMPPYDPATDPSYQALLAQYGLSESLNRNTADQQKAQAGRQAATTIPRIQEQGIEQRRNIGLNAESRGMWRSGQRLRDLSLQQRGESQRLSDVNTGLADRMAGIDTGLQAKLNDLATQRVQAGFEAKLRSSGV